MQLRFDFSGDFRYKTWMREIFRHLRAKDPALAVDAREYKEGHEIQGYPDKIVFFEVLRKYCPEDYPSIVADAKLYPDKLPENLQEARPEGGSTPEAVKADDAVAAPVKKTRRGDRPDPKHWEGKKYDPISGIEWIYNNLGNDEVDWRTAPSMGDYTYLLKLQHNPALCQKFYEQVWTKTLPSTKDIDERRVVQRDDGADISEFYGMLLERTRKVPSEVLRLGVMGVVLPSGEQGVTGDA